jgi:putative addiction module CopG family antidote
MRYTVRVGTDTLNVSLTSDLSAYVEEKKRGGYASASEVVRESLRLMRDRDEQRAKLRAGILAGRDDIAEGRSKPFDAALIRDIARRGKEQAEKRKAKRSA